MPSRKTCLVIEKTRECRIFSKQPTREDVSQRAPSFDCHGILGIVNIEGHNFLVTAASVAAWPAARLRPGVNIHEVQQVRLDPFARNLDLEANPQLAVQRERFLRLWNGNGTGTGFYFAPQADLSMCQQEFFRRKQA